jgi:thymidylate synthase ThyX
MVYEGEGDLNKLFTYIYQSLYSTVDTIIANWETAEALNSYYESIYFLVKHIIHSSEYSIKDITREYSNPTDFTKFLFLVQCGRDVTHEIVRHRPCSYMQASQRYIRYNAKNPYLISLGSRLKEDIRNTVIASAKIAFDTYTELLKTNPPEDARLVLPNCTETKIFIYADRKEVRHFNRMRQSKFAYHPIKEVFDSIYFQMIDKKYL